LSFGLSADTDYADRIRELADKKFLTNSDAHSLPKIAREYNTFEMENISFELFKKVLGYEDKIQNGDNKLNYIVCNNGMYSRLGKYNKTYCDMCECVSEIEDGKCKKCGSKKIVKGVEDRVLEIADGESISPKNRPEYMYKIPLEYIPKLGKKTKEKMLELYGTEMNILNKVSIKNIEENFGKQIAKNIEIARNGNITIVKRRWSGIMEK
jgi:PHP domain protein